MRFVDTNSSYSGFKRFISAVNRSFTFNFLAKMRFSAALLLLFALFSHSAAAMTSRTFCVWDPVGRTGPVMTFYSDVIPKAQAWGLNIKFVAYTEETDAVDAFKAKKCEAVVITSILSRQFVQFAGTMDAIGAINSQEGLELAIATLTRQRAGNLMIEGNYEVVTTFPIGSMYAFVKDRNTDTIEDFAGKKLAILNDDPQMKQFADLAGAGKVNVTLSNFAEKFEKGIVDILIMPALAYNTFELYNGLGEKGGIIDYRLYYGMLQTISRRDMFPEDFGFNMRNYMLTRLKEMNKMVKDAEEEIPEKYWIETNQFVKDDIDHFSKRVRLSLQDSDVNNSTALKLFWKIRCRLDPSRGECKESPDMKSKREKLLAEKQREERKQAAERKKRQQKQQEQNKLALERERIEQERLQQQQEQEKLAQELQRLEEERLRLEQERIQQEQERLEQERLAQEQQKLEQEKRKLEEERLALEQAKQEFKEERWSLWEFLFGWI
ncbi:MAG: putative solute-binding protein [Oleiphilus sp.]